MTETPSQPETNDFDWLMEYEPNPEPKPNPTKEEKPTYDPSDYGLPPVGKEIEPAGKQPLNRKQMHTISTVSYYLNQRNLTVNAETIRENWPPFNNPQIRQRSGEKPSLTALTQHLSSPIYREDMSEWGIEVESDSGGLTDRQLALLNILSNSSSSAGLASRLKKAGVTNSEYKAWLRQKPFNDAFKQITSNTLKDAMQNVDVQLASKAQNGDLKAIQYYNELMGRGPNDKKAVDAMEFARVILESVQEHVKDPEIIKQIAADIDLKSKAIGL